jgi:hypothetical protein
MNIVSPTQGNLELTLPEVTEPMTLNTGVEFVNTANGSDLVAVETYWPNVREYRRTFNFIKEEDILTVLNFFNSIIGEEVTIDGVTCIVTSIFDQLQVNAKNRGTFTVTYEEKV